MTEKIDLKKVMKEFYQPSTKTPQIIDTLPLNFLMIDGRDDPNNNQSYQTAVSTLYSLSYSIKFMIKKTQGVDYVVMPLEGLWWLDDNRLFVEGHKDKWYWTMMIAQPDFITKEMVENAKKEVKKKKGLGVIDDVRFEKYDEGTCVQIMYIGPYADEHPTIMRMHEFATQAGYILDGKHHEIYLGDPNKTAPERLKTVLRQPVRRP
jgi:hypothetical protein